MNKALLIFSVVFPSLILSVKSQLRGNAYQFERLNRGGHCVLISKYHYARNWIQENIYPPVCGFIENEPVFCCPRQGTFKPFSMGSFLLESKVEQNYKEYFDIIKDPLDPSSSQLHVMVVGGVRASAKEFIPMNDIDLPDERGIQLQFNRTLIHEQFDLIASHCLFSEDPAEFKFVRIGDLNLKTITDDADHQNFSSFDSFWESDYQLLFKYIHIPLIKLDELVRYTQYVLSTSLFKTNHLLEHEEGSVIGWGKVNIQETADNLLKGDSVGTMQRESAEDSKQSYPFAMSSIGMGCGLKFESRLMVVLAKLK